MVPEQHVKTVVVAKHFSSAVVRDHRATDVVTGSSVELGLIDQSFSGICRWLRDTRPLLLPLLEAFNERCQKYSEHTVNELTGKI